MKVSFTFKPDLTDEALAIIEELSFHTTKLYNTANYDLTEHGFKTYVNMNSHYAGNWHKEYLHSHNYQHCLKVLEKNWKSYFRSLEDYKSHPSKYKGMPRPPKYKNTDNRKNEIIFTNLAVRVKENTLMLSLSKTMQEKFQVDSLKFVLPQKVQSLVDFHKLQQIRVTYNHSLKQWYLIIVYNKECKPLPEGYHNIMAIDLGSSNLASCSFLENTETFLVSGRPLRSVISYVNRKIAHLQGIAMSMHGSEKHKNTKSISKMYIFRNNYVKDYIHKVSRLVVDKAYEYRCNTIVLGELKDIKQSMDYNKLFVQIPLRMLIDMISYKARLLGMKVVSITEAYTSGCSAIDLEPITKQYYNKDRRTSRGKFLTEQGIAINADINGSLNILRKYVDIQALHAGIPRLITSVRDKGCVENPVKLRVA